MESIKKSTVKTFSWELFHFTILATIIYIISGEWEYAGLGAIIYTGIEAFGYYVHERLWAKFGKGVK
jgi:uncharacterized membrane protein